MEKTTYGGALCFVLLTRYHSGDKIRKTDIDRACGTYGREMCIQSFVEKNLREGDHFVDPCVDGRIILKWTFEK